MFLALLWAHALPREAGRQIQRGGEKRRRVSEERDDRVASFEKRASDEHCAGDCIRPIASSCRRDEVYPEWMVLARHYYDFSTARCQLIDWLDAIQFLVSKLAACNTLASSRLSCRRD